MNFIEIIIYVVLPIVAGVYWFLKKKYEYFENLGIPYSKPSMLFGNMTGVGTKKHFADVMNEIYNENKKKDVICGFFTLITPSVFVYDLDAIKDILIKDFNNFTDRGMYVNEEDDPLSAHLFSIEGEKWRFLRNKLSPVFTSGKIKNMMPIITEKSDNLVNELEKIAKSNNNSLDAKLLMNNFTIDVICSTVFGMEANTLKGEHKELAKITKEIFSEEGVSSFRFFILFAFPKLAKFFRMRNFPKHISDFFFDVIGGNMKNREDNNIVRKDFLDMLMQLMNKGSIEGEISTDNRKLTFNEAVAQGFLFFFAGSDTSSTALSYALVELSHNPRVQDKLRKEIKEKVASSNGVITYENIQEMTYLSYVVNG
jgi:cytochrome P450 family 6